MARRRTKKRTHLGAQSGVKGSNASMDRSPKSMVVRIGAGEVGPSVSQLVKDVRAMMEPGTAARLKERKANKLKDYITMAGPLGVSHLLLFSRSNSGNTNLRIALTPRGPTLHFKVEKYSLCKDVKKAMKHPKGGKKEFLTAPLLVMNNFVSPPPAVGATPAVPKHLESLITSIFQSLFPPISPQTTPLPSVRRVLLLNREPPSPQKATAITAEPINPDQEENGTYTITLRHYAITTKATNLSRPLRRLTTTKLPSHSKPNVRGKSSSGLPNLGRLTDVADYLLDPAAATASGYTTATSDSEMGTDAEVEVLAPQSRKVLSGTAAQRRKKLATQGEGRGVEKRAVRLVELGPRMRLRMIKVEEEVCGGKVMWHEYLHKTKEEVKAMEEVWEKRRKEKEERRRKQKEDVERKKAERAKSGAGKNTDKDGDEEMGEDDDEDYDEEDYDRMEWDSEGLEGDAEMLLNEEKEADGEWSDEEEEIAAG